jgi:hypothetical protein
MPRDLFLFVVQLFAGEITPHVCFSLFPGTYFGRWYDEVRVADAAYGVLTLE